MSLSEQVPLMSDARFWLFAGISILLALAGFWGGQRGLRRARRIEDIPTSRIRSAHQGYVELQGQARPMSGEPLVAPLSKLPCCWFRYKVEKYRDDNWETIKTGTSDTLFLLNDSTGECVVDPEGADVIPRHKSTWYGNNENFENINSKEIVRGVQQGVLKVGGISLKMQSGGSRDYRYTEQTIIEGDQLYALGLFKSLDDLDHQASRAEIVRDLLREWKANALTLMQRFDHNRDGNIDEKEWADARRAAQQRAIEVYAETETHLHTLSRPLDSSMVFLISSVPQTALISRYRWQTRGGFILFLAAGSVAAVLLGARLWG